MNEGAHGRVAVIIPARAGSTRFPRKPLAMVAGRTMIERVWRIATAAIEREHVFVSTESEEVSAEVNRFGGQVVMTEASCQNGSERTAATYDLLVQRGTAYDYLVNFQGDAVLTPPWVLGDLIATCRASIDDAVVTLATTLTEVEREKLALVKSSGEVSGTLVVCDREGRALYFSKAIIPFMRNVGCGCAVTRRHIGIYAYTPPRLREFLTLGVSPLEAIEGLEPLRLIEYGVPVRVIEAHYRGRTHGSIDSPADVSRIEEIIAREGELW